MANISWICTKCQYPEDKFSAVAGQKFLAGPNLAERAKSRGYGKFLKFSFLKLLKMHQILKTSRAAQLYSTCTRLLFDYKELGLNADHTDFCGNIQLIKEIINHKAQPQGKSPLSTGFYYQQDCLKECLFVLILASVILFICRQTLVFPTPNLFFDTSKTRKGGG